MTTTPGYHDTPTNVLARAVAQTFGGAVHNNDDGELFADYAVVVVPAFGGTPAYEIQIARKGYGARPSRTHVSLFPALRDTDVSTANLRRPEITVDGDRDAQAICADISRRVVNAPGTLEFLRTYDARRLALRERHATLAGTVAALTTEFPWLRKTTPGAPTNECGLYGKGVNLRVSNDSVRFDFMSLTHAQARAVLAALAKREG